MTATKNFAVFDSDSHVVEPPELWEKYLDPEYRTLGKHALWRQEGPTGAYLKVNGEIFRDRSNPNLPRHALWRPGMTWEAIGELDRHTRHPATEGASDPQARLSDMDAMGVDRALLIRPGSPKASSRSATPTSPTRSRAPTMIGSSTSAKRHRSGSSPRRSCRCRIWISRSRNWLGWRPSRRSAPSSFGRCSSKTATSIIRITIRCGRS